MICKIQVFSLKKIIYPWKIESIENNIPIKFIELYGLCVNYKNKSYIFSTAHNINHDSNFLCNGKELNLLYLNKDLDVLILDNNINLDYTTSYDIKLNFNKNSIFINNYLNKLIILEYESIIESNINIIGPNILLINCKQESNSIDLEEGFSGIGLLDYNNNYIGLVSRRTKYNVQLNPLINYFTILDKNNNLCYFYEDLKLDKSILLINKKCNKYYNNKNKKSDKFNLNDILLTIDNHDIIEGYVYCNMLNIKLSIYTYILYYKANQNLTNFVIKRKNKIKNINIYTNIYKYLVNIKYQQNTKYEIIDGKVKYDLDLDILIDFLVNKKSIDYPNNFLENIKNNKIYSFIENI